MRTPPPSRPGPLPEPDEAALLHSGRLHALIRNRIDAAGGWISFAEYAEMALYQPGLGYYVAGAAKFGGPGDFVTAPELSALFGATLATQVGDVLAQTGGQVLEVGAGSGALAADVLAGLQAQGRLPRRYLILEISPDLARRQRDTLARRVPELLGHVEWVAAPPRDFDGVMLANELLDALPMHVLSWREQGVAERGVGLRDEGLAWSEAPLSQPGLREAAAAIDVEAPYVSELSLAAPALVRTLAAALRRGILLFVDYGFGRDEYYHPQRREGTLMCHYRHHAHDDPFFLPGLQDITAHVDFSAIARAGSDAGLALLGYTTQAHFLVNCGITRLLARTSPETAGTYLPLAAGVQKLLSPAEMGELFKVIALGRGIDTPLAGFCSGDKSRLL